MTIVMIPVKSASIEAIGHDADRRHLKVQFKSGETYLFEGVTRDHHAALIAAPSKGAHFQKHVRGKFKATKL